MIASLKHNLTNVLNFRGREPQGLFWPYAGLVIFLSCMAMFAIMVPEMMVGMERMQRFAVAHPELATIEQGPGSYSISVSGYHPELMPDLSRLASLVGLVVAPTILLLAAAVVRRLHDRGRSGLWALLPALFLSFGLVSFANLLRQGSPNIALFAVLFLNNVLYLASLALVIVFLAGRSAAGDNRYGAPLTR